MLPYLNRAGPKQTQKVKRGPFQSNVGPKAPGMTGGLGKPKPAKPAGPTGAPTGPEASPLPPVGQLNDSGYNNDINAINTGYANKQTSLDAQQYQTRSQFGFDPEFAQNPYTRMNMMVGAYNKANQQTTHSYANRGQLYSGALDRARGYDAEGFNRGQYEARGEYDQLLAGIEASRLEAETEKAGGSAKAYEAMLERKLAKDPDTSLYPEPAPGKDGKGGQKGSGNKDYTKDPYKPGGKKKSAFKRTGPKQKRPELDPGFHPFPGPKPTPKQKAILNKSKKKIRYS